MIGFNLVNQQQQLYFLSGGENKFVKITDSKSCEKEFMVFVPKIAPVAITSINTLDNLCTGML